MKIQKLPNRKAYIKILNRRKKSNCKICAIIIIINMNSKKKLFITIYLKCLYISLYGYLYNKMVLNLE